MEDERGNGAQVKTSSVRTLITHKRAVIGVTIHTQVEEEGILWWWWWHLCYAPAISSIIMCAPKEKKKEKR